MMSALVRAILGVPCGLIVWNLLNLLRILDLEGIVKEFRGFCVVAALFVAFWDNERIF
jgi:hypothetical protein